MFYKFSRYEALRLFALFLSWPLLQFTLLRSQFGADIVPTSEILFKVGCTALLWLLFIAAVLGGWYILYWTYRGLVWLAKQTNSLARGFVAGTKEKSRLSFPADQCQEGLSSYDHSLDRLVDRTLSFLLCTMLGGFTLLLGGVGTMTFAVNVLNEVNAPWAIVLAGLGLASAFLGIGVIKASSYVGSHD